LELGAAHDASPSPPPKVVDIGLGLEGMTAIGRRGCHLCPSMVVVVGQESKPDACSTHVRPCAIYTRAGERGRTESGLTLFPRQKSVGRETFHSCPPARANATALDLVSWARQRGTEGGPERGRALCPRMAGNSDESVLGATGPGCHPGAVRRPDKHLDIAGTAPVQVRPTRSSLRDSAATEGSVHGYSRLAVPFPHRPSQTRPYAAAGFPFVRRFPAAARPLVARERARRALAWRWHYVRSCQTPTGLVSCSSVTIPSSGIRSRRSLSTSGTNAGSRLMVLVG
jgi:hypothetical protein